jgi:hypothetical protein
MHHSSFPPPSATASPPFTGSGPNGSIVRAPEGAKGVRHAALHHGLGFETVERYGASASMAAIGHWVGAAHTAPRTRSIAMPNASDIQPKF